MLKTLELNNFKSHQSTKLTFDGSRLHALVGGNSSGKTSVLQALNYFGELIVKSQGDVFKGACSPAHLVTRGKEQLSVISKGTSLMVNPPKGWEASYKCWYERTQWRLDHKLEIPHLSFDKSSSKTNEKDRIYLKLDSRNLMEAAYSEEIAPQIDAGGLKLAPALDYLRSENLHSFQTLQEMLKRVVPSVQKVGIVRAKVLINRQRLIEVDGKAITYDENQEVIGQEVVLDMDTGDRIPAHAISEGTMLALGLLTVLMHPNRPQLILLDDIEQGLHPKAQRELMNVFKEIIQANPELQIIFSTHSPYIVDELTPSQVHVLSIDSSGMTQTKRLDEHPDIEWAKQTLTTGEFWDAEGEDWVIAGLQNNLEQVSPTA
ncbi:MAG: AAA family ATPase [Cyanobacteria bacterium P01_F01_bin.150]